MLRFHIVIHGFDGEKPQPLSVSFERALAALEALPRLFIEPDGSLVWASREPGGESWQVDGNLYDQGSRLSHVELSGCCPERAMDEILRALDWPASGVCFQLPRRGVFLDETAFRETASSAAGAY